jgi:hypothetical protein
MMPKNKAFENLFQHEINFQTPNILESTFLIAISAGLF